MATEYKLPYTGAQIAQKLGKVDTLETQISQLSSEIGDLDVPQITQSAGESTSLVMSQKAVTDLVSEALNSSGGVTTEYETVDSVDEMVDTSKSYVLSSTGTVWTYGEITVETDPPNKLVASTATLNKRLSGSGGTVSANNGAIGSFVTDYIAVSDMADVDQYIMRLNWDFTGFEGSYAAGENKIVYYNASKTRLASNIAYASNTWVENGCSVVDWKMNYNDPPTWSEVAYIRLQLFVKETGTSITVNDLAGLTITFDHQGGTITEMSWYDTGIANGYEVVDSVEEMVNPNKQYVLRSTGTIWAAKKSGELIPAFTNLADPTSSDWLTDYRLNSSGGLTAETGQIVTNYFKCSLNDVIRVKGVGNMKTNNKVQYFYDNSKNPVCAYYANTDTAHNVLEYTDGINKFLAGTYLGDSKAATAYARLCFVGPLDVNNIIITVNEEITYTDGYTWYNTGATPSSNGGNGGGNYIGLLVKINQNTSDISEIDNRVTALETGSDSVTIPTFWQSAVDACITKIKALQVGRNCVTFPFFSDNHQRNGYAGMLIAHIMKECHIPYAFFGGDSISNGYIDSEETMIEQDAAFDASVSYIPNGRFCRAVGNHDGYWNVSAATGDEYHYSDAQIYELFLREESIAQNKHFGGDGTYYYVDDISSKVRWIVLDTNDGTVEAEQISWLQNTALSFSESGWAVVFISHQPISNHYHALISNAAEVRAVVTNYMNGSSANKAAVVGWFSGHIHRDRIYTGIATNTENDDQGTAMGFTQVTITSDHTAIAYDDATKHAIANDDQSHAIDFVTINKTTRKVNLTRLGVGSDRSYTY